MAKDPGDRYQSAAEMQQDIQRALSGMPVAAPTRAEMYEGTRAMGPGTMQACPTSAIPAYRYGPQDQPPPGGRSKAWLWVIIGLAAVLLIGSGVYALHYASSKGGTISVPSVAGLTKAQAETVPCILRWPGRVPAGKVENAIMSGLDWFPTLVAAAGNSNIAEELKNGKQLGDRNYKVHLDGYNQTDLVTGKGPSARHEIFYFTEGTLSAVRIDDFKYRFTDQPNGWLGATVKVDWPILTNIRLDPFERTGNPTASSGSLAYYNWFAIEFWRFVLVQQEVGKLAQTALEFPPMQKGASFNLEAVKEQIDKAMQAHAGK